MVLWSACWLLLARFRTSKALVLGGNARQVPLAPGSLIVSGRTGWAEGLAIQRPAAGYWTPQLHAIPVGEVFGCNGRRRSFRCAATWA